MTARAGTIAQAAHRRSLTVADRDAKAAGEVRKVSLLRAQKAAEQREADALRGEQARLKAEAAARRAASVGA